MSKQFEVGKQYRLVDASRNHHLSQLLDSGTLTLPEGGVFTCHNVDDYGYCKSYTEGIKWRGYSLPADDRMIPEFKETGGWVVARPGDLDAGAFEEVVLQ